MPISVIQFLLLSFALTASASVVAAATDTPLSIYQLAEKNDAEIQAAYAALQAERETRKQSTGALLPSLVLTGEVAANREDVDNQGSVGYGDLLFILGIQPVGPGHCYLYDPFGFLSGSFPVSRCYPRTMLPDIGHFKQIWVKPGSLDAGPEN